ncbi:MAG: chloride channel protein [Bacteroidetes bacterium]|jgi:CIC family chloride channel protein|nr:chloride channel protein [Bacteroidota bacterium]
MQERSPFSRFLIWRIKHVPDSYFVLLLSVIIGLAAGISAFLLKSFVFYIKDLLTGFFDKSSQNLWYILYPGVGILISLVLVHYLLKDKTTHGIPRILYVISRLDGKMRWHKYFSSMLGSSFTAGFGGSIGLESPIISAGASIASGISQQLRLNYKNTVLLIGCGAAGAMASIFTTPIAAVVFGLEVLLLDLTTASIIPLLIASVTGAITAKLLLSDEILIHFEVTQPFEIHDMHFYILLGVISGMVSLYYSWMHHSIRKRFLSFGSRKKRFVFGSLALGLLIFIFPPLYGEGYEAIKLVMTGESDQLLNNTFLFAYKDVWWVFILFMASLVLLKVIATSLTVEAGGIGGIFAPAAVMGGLTGFALSKFINHLGFMNPLHEGNFTLVGMAAVLGGVLHAPLTAIFLIAEMSNGYELIVPLMMTTAIAFVTVKIASPHSIFTKQLAESGDLLTHDKDKTVLTLLNIKQVIDNDLLTISPDATLGELTKLIIKSKRNIFPVVEADNTYVGVIDMDDVRKDMFNQKKYNEPISTYMIQAKEQVSTNDPMERVMEKFRKTGYFNLPVIDNGKYIGFVSRANIFNAYRQVLKDVTIE